MGKFCGNCGYQLRENLKFCPKCGQLLEEQEIDNKKIVMTKEEQWKYIYDSTYAKAYSIALQMTRNKDDAMDMLQETYISVFKKMDTLRDINSAKAWVNSIIANKCRDLYESKRAKKQVSFEDMTPEDKELHFEENIEDDRREFLPEESIDYSETKAIMQKILTELADEQRLCILMYYYEELSVGEIAEAMECSPGTVKSRLNYARKYIKKEIEALEKKGTKLYSVAPLPFIVWMLSSQEHTISADIAKLSDWNTIKTLVDAEMIKGDIAEATAGSKNAVTAQQAAKTAVKAGSKHIVRRVVAGVVAVAVLGTAGYVGYQKFHTKPAAQTEESTTKKPTPEKEVKKAEEKKEEKPIEPLTFSDDDKQVIEHAAYLYDLSKKEADGYDNRQEYTYDLADNKIPQDVLKTVAASIACDLSADGMTSTFGTEVRGEAGYNETTLPTDVCIDYLENTFGYEAKDQEALTKVFTAEGNDAVLMEDNSFGGGADTIYNAWYVAQTGKDEYHIYVEVQPYGDMGYATQAIMDITAHRNEESKIAGFVFDKIEFIQDSRKNRASIGAGTVVDGLARLRRESLTTSSMDAYDPRGVYDVNQLDNEQFIALADGFINAYMGGELEQDPNYPDHWDEFIMPIAEYDDICRNTLGRTSDVDYSQYVRGDNMTLGTGWLDAMYVTEKIQVIQNYDGTVEIAGVLGDYWASPQKYYSFTATGHADEASQLGFVIDQMNILDEVATPEG